MVDEYLTLAAPSTGLYSSRGSKFLAYAYPLESESGLNGILQQLRSDHPKARHWCYAYRVGEDHNRWRANDDGEPSGSAGRPILGQIDAAGLSNVLIVVVRYFGGTKLGVPGLIEAYKTASQEALACAEVTKKHWKRYLQVSCGYAEFNELMQALKREPWLIERQALTDSASFVISCPKSLYEESFRELWLVLAKAYPGEEKLDQQPAGFKLQPMEGLED